MSLELRDYQSATINETRAHLRAGKRSILIQGATGSGKTCLTAHMIAAATAKNKISWFAVHRSELIDQSVAMLRDSAGLDVGIIAAGYGGNGYLPVQVCSIQTLMRRWQKYPLPDLLVIDECHHACAKSWSDLLLALLTAKPSMKVIGLTATPSRLDGRGLGEWFEVMVQGPTVASLIADKYLSPYVIFAPSMPDLKNVHTVAGDYNKGELDVAMRGSRVTGDAITEYRSRCMGKRALMFLWSVKASEEMAAAFNAQGIPAAHLDGKTNDDARRKSVAGFREGRIKVLTNVEIVTEGFDLPAIEACFLLRPTQSLGLYLQMVGRALRPFPGKDRAMILDHSGLVFQHGLPDMERDWSFAGVERGKGKKKQEVPIRQCMKCYAVMPAAVKVCSECGHAFDVQYREVAQEAGELQELNMEAMQRLFGARAKKVEVAQAQDYDSLLRIEKERGYKPGWARHIANARDSKLRRQADQFRPQEER